MAFSPRGLRRGDLRRSWKVLAITDLAYKAIAFALLMPATTLVLYWLLVLLQSTEQRQHPGMNHRRDQYLMLG